MKKVGRRTIAQRALSRSPGSRFLPRASTERVEKWRRAMERACRVLAMSSTDQTSEVRLAHLRGRLQSYDRGTVESASAELEVAMLLLGAGAQVSFLPEARARTADLECTTGDDRFFVEVTAMVGRRRRRKANRGGRPLVGRAESDNPPEPLTARVVARDNQKAKQLQDYCAPVLLAITHPPSERGAAVRPAA